MSIDKLIAAATEYFELAAARERRLAEPEAVRTATPSTAPAAGVISTAKAEDPTPVAKEPATKKPTTQVKAVVDADDFDISAPSEPKVDTPAPEVHTANATVADTPALSYEADIRPLIRTVSMTKRNELVALLAEFGCKVGAELKPEQYTAFFAALKAL